MNKFAGTLTFTGEVEVNKIQDKHLVVKSQDSEYTTIFLLGNTKYKTSEELIKSYNIWELYAYDISISTEDNMTILNNEIDKEGLYEVASFESSEADLRDIIERFQDSFEVMCVREAEESEKFGNRIIKADFIY